MGVERVNWALISSSRNKVIKRGGVEQNSFGLNSPAQEFKAGGDLNPNQEKMEGGDIWKTLCHLVCV